VSCTGYWIHATSTNKCLHYFVHATLYTTTLPVYPLLTTGQLSPVQPVLYGVPQGSCLGPLLFVLYTSKLSQVVAKHRLTLHQYADDCQIYHNMLPSETTSGVQRFERCLVDVEKWMRASRLRLNSSKTNILWLGSKHIIDNLSVQEVNVVSSTITTVASARNLGVVIDSRLTMSDHVAAVCRAGYYRLRQLRPTVKSLPVDAAKTLIQAFITNRLDYCNAALCGITGTLLRKLQSVQNAVARLLTRTGRREHISPILRQLHWLPVSRHIDFKLAVLFHANWHPCTNKTSAS